MGHKVNPISFRLSISKDWRSKWFPPRAKFKEYLLSDIEIREKLNKRFGKTAGIEKIETIRDADQVKIVIHTSRPGVLIGRSGQGINDLRLYLVKSCSLLRDAKTGRANHKIEIDVMEVKEPNLSSELVAQNVAAQIEKRIAYKRAIKQALAKVTEAKAKGVKIAVAGRLGGAEIARREQFTQGSVPLGRLRAKIDYAERDALTTYGIIGVKVWIYKGDQLLKKEE